MTDSGDAKAHAICRLAVDFREADDATLRDLLSRTGYRHGDPVTAGELVPILREHPDWVDAWLALSEDKRTSAGWFVQDVRNQLVVGSTSSTHPALYFDDKAVAVAEFIVRDIDEISTALPTRIRDSVVRKLRLPSGDIPEH